MKNKLSKSALKKETKKAVMEERKRHLDILNSPVAKGRENQAKEFCFDLPIIPATEVIQILQASPFDNSIDTNMH